MSEANIDRRRRELTDEKAALMKAHDGAINELIGDAHALGTEAALESATAAEFERIDNASRKLRANGAALKEINASLRALG